MAHVQLWTVHGDGRHLGPTEVVAPDERLTWNRTISIGMQHVVAMFGATFLVPVLTGFPPTTTIFFSGVGTLMFFADDHRTRSAPRPAQLHRQQLRIHLAGHRGETHGGIAVALGGIFAAGAVLFVIGFLVDRYGSQWINVLMPPVVTGAVVALIGLNLAPTAQSASSPTAALDGDHHAVRDRAVHGLFSGFFGRISILLGVIVGYLVAWPQQPARPAQEQLERREVVRLRRTSPRRTSPGGRSA